MAFLDPKERWLRTYLTKHAEEIEKAAGPALVPVLGHALGCGGFGCVFPTQTPGIVLKATWDPEEGAFVRRALELPCLPEGLVRYVLVIDHPNAGADPDALRLDPAAFDDTLFLLWREEASFASADLLTPTEKHALDALHRLTVELEIALRSVLETRYADRLAQTIAEELHHPDPAWAAKRLPYETERDFLVQARLGYAAVRQALWALPPGRLCHVARAIEFYLEHDTLLPDVAPTNVATVHRPDGPVLAIIDPGLAVDFRPPRRRKNPLPASLGRVNVHVTGPSTGD